MTKTPIDYVGIATKLGGDILRLQPERAPSDGVPSPGNFMIINLSGRETRLDPHLLEALDRALKD